MSESSDEEPLNARRARLNGKIPVIESDSDSPLPDWISQHQSPWGSAPVVISSDDDNDTDAVPKEEPSAAGPSKPKISEETTQPAEPGPSHATSQRGPAKASAVAKPNLGAMQATSIAKLPAVQEGLQGEVAIMFPEKPSEAKLLVELETAEGSATDLTGDAGVVGRLLVEGPPGEQELRLDLKGTLYGAVVVPCASTLMVVNIGSGAEGKVESLMQSYVQLREVAGAGGGESLEEGTLPDYFGDDDDNYQMGNDEPGPKEKGTKKKAATTAKAGHKAFKKKPAGAKGMARAAGKAAKRKADGGPSTKVPKPKKPKADR